MSGTTKLLAFGAAAGRSAEALLNDVLDVCAERGIDRGAVRGEAFSVQPPAPKVGALTAHLFVQGGPLLDCDPPDAMLTLWLPDPHGGTAIGRAWPGSATYSVEESVNIDGPSDGICRVAIVTRNLRLSRQDFWNYWNGHHVPLVIDHVPLFFRYVNNLVLDEQALIDGIAQQWFTDLDAIAEHDRLNAEEKAEVAADMPRFLGRRQTLLAELSASHVGRAM